MGFDFEKVLNIVSGVGSAVSSVVGAFGGGSSDDGGSSSDNGSSSGGGSGLLNTIVDIGGKLFGGKGDNNFLDLLGGGISGGLGGLIGGLISPKDGDTGSSSLLGGLGGILGSLLTGENNIFKDGSKADEFASSPLMTILGKALPFLAPLIGGLFRKKKPSASENTQAVLGPEQGNPVGQSLASDPSTWTVQERLMVENFKHQQRMDVEMLRMSGNPTAPAASPFMQQPLNVGAQQPLSFNVVSPNIAGNSLANVGNQFGQPAAPGMMMRPPVRRPMPQMRPFPTSGRPFGPMV